MKLLNKTGLYNFILSLSIIAAGAVCFYWVILRFENIDATEKVYEQRQRIKRELPQIDSIPANSIVINNDIRYIKLRPSDTIQERLIDTIINEKYDDDDVPYRVLICNVHTKLYNYEALISQSLVESDGLIQSIIVTVFSLLAIYLISLVLINRFISRSIWEPFYTILSELRDFDIQRSDEIHLSKTDIDEFNSLNSALEQMTAKIKSDYQNLKEFAENASHEIQTPLAIIRSKVELLLQSDQVNELQWKNLNAINEAVTRLSRLNQSLLLLSKIENGQFNQTEPIDLSNALKKNIENLNELISAGGIKLQNDIEPEVMIYIHPYLLDILLSNLIMNAIRHNIANGFINIHLKKGELTIENSGGVLTTDPKNLFSRFKKGTSDKDSIGIGLSLVQKITESSGLELTYSYNDQIHTIKINF